jgi:hypothetical protein
VLRVLLERVVELTVVRLRRRVCEVVVVRGLFPGFLVEVAGGLVMQVLERGLHASTLLQQRLSKTIGVDDAHAPCPFPAADERRRSI